MMMMMIKNPTLNKVTKKKLGFIYVTFFSIFLVSSFSSNIQLTIIKVFISEKLEKTCRDVLFL